MTTRLTSKEKTQRLTQRFWARLDRTGHNECWKLDERELRECNATTCKMHAKAAKWYAEPTGATKPGHGYQSGTLLFFSIRDC